MIFAVPCPRSLARTANISSTRIAATMSGASIGKDKGVVVWCIDMLGRVPALALTDTLAQHGFDLLPESVIVHNCMYSGLDGTSWHA